MKRYIIKYRDDAYLLTAEFDVSETYHIRAVVTNRRDKAMAFEEKERYFASALAKSTGGKVETK